MRRPTGGDRVHKARIVAVILAALVMGGLGAGGAEAFTFRLDQGWIRSTLLGLVNAQFAGRVRIEGDISIGIGTQLTVAVEDVVVDNPDWAQGDLARFGEVRAVLPIGPLLQGQLVFNELELTGARADLV